MDKIPTAVKYFNDHRLDSDTSYSSMMIEFAKLHVQAALEAAAKGEISLSQSSTLGFNQEQKNSILNAYPLENIK